MPPETPSQDLFLLARVLYILSFRNLLLKPLLLLLSYLEEKRILILVCWKALYSQCLKTVL